MKKILLGAILFLSTKIFAVDILNNGILHSKMSPIKVEDQSEWYALIKNSQQYEVKKIKIGVRKAEPGENGNAEEGDWIVSSDPNAILLLRGINLKEGPITSGKGGLILVGKLMDLGFNGFQLFATGEVNYIEREHSNRYLIIDDYEVFLRKDGVNTPVVSAKKIPYGYKTSWVGDLNSDGYPDFIIWTDVHEHSFPDSLYMSEKGDGSSPVKYILIGSPQYQGC